MLVADMVGNIFRRKLSLACRPSTPLRWETAPPATTRETSQHAQVLPHSSRLMLHQHANFFCVLELQRTQSVSFSCIRVPLTLDVLLPDLCFKKKCARIPANCAAAEKRSIAANFPRSAAVQTFDAPGIIQDSEHAGICAGTSSGAFEAW